MSYSAPQYGVGWAASHTINNLSPYSSCVQIGMVSTAYTHPANDLAIYCPVRFHERVVVRRLMATIQVPSGNVDIGIYSAGGIRLVSTGTTAAASDLTVDVTDTVVGPGLFYLAFTADNTTVSYVGPGLAAPILCAYGVLTQQLGAGAALPATATWAVNQTNMYAPGLAAVVSAVIA